MYRSFLLVCLSLAAVAAFAQSPAGDHAWLNTDNIAVRITPTGIHADSTGSFLLKRNGAAPVNLLSHLAPWMGGIDPGGNLHLACEMNDPAHSDWKPGYKGVPNSGRVWKVTREQIFAHIADFQDNGLIDNPILEIFSWPGRGNPYSIQINGFEVPFSGFLSADFYDKDDDGIYVPDNGDYPIAIAGHQYFFLFPDQMAYSPFFNDQKGPLSSGRSMDINASLMAITFDCKGNEFVENAIFLLYSYQYAGLERIDSTFSSIYADLNIGNVSDDYLGFDGSHNNMVYAYNADSDSDSIAGQSPPMIGVTFFRGPLDTFGLEVPLKKVIPIFEGNTPDPTTKPRDLSEFFNYLTGSWRDGNPLTVGGIGYGGTIPTNFAFPGKPGKPNEWSELSANNPNGDRKAVASFQINTLFPNMTSEIIISITASKLEGVAAQLDQLKAFKFLQDKIINKNNPQADTLISLCFSPVNLIEKSIRQEIEVMPNPVNTQLTVYSQQTNIHHVCLFNLLGQVVLEQATPTAESAELTLDTSHLPPGLYTLHWQLKNGRHGVEKIVVAR